MSYIHSTVHTTNYTHYIYPVYNNYTQYTCICIVDYPNIIYSHLVSWWLNNYKLPIICVIYPIDKIKRIRYCRLSTLYSYDYAQYILLSIHIIYYTQYTCICIVDYPNIIYSQSATSYTAVKTNWTNKNIYLVKLFINYIYILCAHIRYSNTPHQYITNTYNRPHLWQYMTWWPHPSNLIIKQGHPYVTYNNY